MTFDDRPREHLSQPCPPGTRAHDSCTLVYMSRPSVDSDALDDAVKAYMQAVEAEQRARIRLHEAIHRSITEGELSESAAARRTGLNRGTIRRTILKKPSTHEEASVGTEEVHTAVAAFMDAQEHAGEDAAWEGPVADLHHHLREHAPPRASWPTSTIAFGRQLTSAAKPLLDAGIKIQWRRTAGQRRIRLDRVEGGATRGRG